MHVHDKKIAHYGNEGKKSCSYDRPAIRLLGKKWYKTEGYVTLGMNFFGADKVNKNDHLEHNFEKLLFNFLVIF